MKDKIYYSYYVCFGENMKSLNDFQAFKDEGGYIYEVESLDLSGTHISFKVNGDLNSLVDMDITDKYFKLINDNVQLNSTRVYVEGFTTNGNFEYETKWIKLLVHGGIPKFNNRYIEAPLYDFDEDLMNETKKDRSR